MWSSHVYAFANEKELYMKEEENRTSGCMFPKNSKINWCYILHLQIHTKIATKNTYTCHNHQTKEIHMQKYTKTYIIKNESE